MKICATPSCGKKSRAVGLCMSCYRKAKRQGNAPKAQTREKKFWARVDKTSYAPCWIWTGGKRPPPWEYGQLQVKGRQIGAHRFSYQIMHGSIPSGMHVLHRCDNPSCVNPAHLFVGSHADNMADKVAKNRQTRGSKQHSAKLTENDVIQIRRALAASEASEVALAKKFGVTQANISCIHLGKTWGWLSPHEIKEK